MFRGGHSLAVQWLGFGVFTARGPGSTPGWGTKIPQAARRGPKKKKCSEALFIIAPNWKLPKYPLLEWISCGIVNNNSLYTAMGSNQLHFTQHYG